LRPTEEGRINSKGKCERQRSVNTSHLRRSRRELRKGVGRFKLKERGQGRVTQFSIRPDTRGGNRNGGGGLPLIQGAERGSGTVKVYSMGKKRIRF